jgi:hypothetical protein
MLFAVLASPGIARSGADPISSGEASIKPGIQLRAPARAASFGPIRVQVTMVADIPTYNANSGILDQALNVVLVRRDGPGFLMLPKIDPRGLLKPMGPMPPTPPGMSPMSGFIKEERELDVLGFGMKHEGAADYFVVGSFANWLAEPLPMSIEDRQQRLPTADFGKARQPAPNSIGTLSPPGRPGITAKISPGPQPAVDGILRVPVRPSRFSGEPEWKPFVTIVAARIDTLGGISVGSYLLDAKREGRDWVASFSVPLAGLSPKPGSGKYRVLVFSGDECSGPREIELE